jgi:hypothetical protein
MLFIANDALNIRCNWQFFTWMFECTGSGCSLSLLLTQASQYQGNVFPSTLHLKLCSPSSPKALTPCDSSISPVQFWWCYKIPLSSAILKMHE